MIPDLILVGQLTVDHVVPAAPGVWAERIGGNALYAAAGARLWLAPGRIKVVARLARDFPVDVAALLTAAGVHQYHLPRQSREALVEWLLYEADGSRRSIPRNAHLRDAAAEGGGSSAAYREHLADLSASAADIPAEWLPTAAVYLAAQVIECHRDSVARLHHCCEFLAVDPSPHYSRRADTGELAAWLRGASALLPSEQEVRHLAANGWSALAAQLQQAGFAEVCLKRGGVGVVVATAAGVTTLAATPARVQDPTGAGDAFGGAYAACRLQGYAATEAAHRAQIAAAMVIECDGAPAALALDPAEAHRRLTTTLTETPSHEPS